MSLKVESYDTFGLPHSMSFQGYSLLSNCVAGLKIHDFIFAFNNNIWPNSAPLRATSLQNLSDSDFDLPKSHQPNVMMRFGLHKCKFLMLMVIYALAQLSLMTKKS